jgi:hypothetical protein
LNQAVIPFRSRISPRVGRPSERKYTVSKSVVWRAASRAAW